MNRMRLITFVLVIVFLLTAFVGCAQIYDENKDVYSSAGEDDKSVESRNDKEKDEHNKEVDFFCYLDSNNKTATVDDLDVYLDRVYEQKYDNVSINFSLKMKNTAVHTNKCRIGDIKVYRENTGATYNCYLGLFQDDEFNLESDITESISIKATIPTSYKSEKYYLDVIINDNILRFYLYDDIQEETIKHPEETLPSVVTVEYVVDGKTVKTEEKNINSINERYVWYSNDGLYYCVKWSKASYDNTHIMFIGSSNPIIRYSTTSSDVYTFASQLNYDDVYPQNGVLVIPTEFDGKPVCISNYFFSISMTIAGIKTVYIGNVKKIYSQNLANTSIKTIYYAGTKEQWDAYGVKIPDKITIIYNTPYQK